MLFGKSTHCPPLPALRDQGSKETRFWTFRPESKYKHKDSRPAFHASARLQTVSALLVFSAALGSLLSLPFEAAWLQPGGRGACCGAPYPPPPAPSVRAWWEADWKAGRSRAGAAGISPSWEEKPWAHLLVFLR